MQTSNNISHLNHRDDAGVIEFPKRLDILCGQGKSCWNHEGTRCFRKVIQMFCQRYQLSSTKQKKMGMTKEIFETLQESGSRFLKYDVKTKSWQQLSEVAARDKISHALRFANQQHKKPSLKNLKTTEEQKAVSSNPKISFDSHKKVPKKSHHSKDMRKLYSPRRNQIGENTKSNKVDDYEPLPLGLDVNSNGSRDHYCASLLRLSDLLHEIKDEYDVPPSPITKAIDMVNSHVVEPSAVFDNDCILSEANSQINWKNNDVLHNLLLDLEFSHVFVKPTDLPDSAVLTKWFEADVNYEPIPMLTTDLKEVGDKLNGTCLYYDRIRHYHCKSKSHPDYCLDWMQWIL